MTTRTHLNSNELTFQSIPLVPFQMSSDLSIQSQSLLNLLQERTSTREFSDTDLSLETLSNLLWAAAGINRPEETLRTVPSTKNWQEIDIYVAMEAGLYRFDPHSFSLRLVLDEDIRAATGSQDFAGQVPVNLIYVADLAKMENVPIKEKKFYTAVDTGFISQNVYLFCAAQGLATVVRGLVDRPALASIMGLGSEQRVILTQSVGYPKETQ